MWTYVQKTNYIPSQGNWVFNIIFVVYKSGRQNRQYEVTAFQMNAKILIYVYTYRYYDHSLDFIGLYWHSSWQTDRKFLKPLPWVGLSELLYHLIYGCLIHHDWWIIPSFWYLAERTTEPKYLSKYCLNHPMEL